MHLYFCQLLKFATLFALANGHPAANGNQGKSNLLPLVVWHGLGDTYDSPGIRHIEELANKVHPGIFTHSIRLDPDPGSDRTASFFGSLNSQLAFVCEQLASIPELSSGFNAIGFSQGGQFLRAYVERCNKPPVRTLITYGSQHNGIADFFGECKPLDWVCRSTSSLLKNNKWSNFVQNKVVPAQYFRDPEDLDNYLEHSAFLADINNERETKNSTYRKNLASLNRFVMYMFEDDKTVIPKESGWFMEVNRTSGRVTKLEDRPLYKEDWLGLRKLGEAGKLVFGLAPGEHMQLNEEQLIVMMKDYLGDDKPGTSVLQHDQSHGTDL